jgi:hypothetical protein
MWATLVVKYSDGLSAVLPMPGPSGGQVVASGWKRTSTNTASRFYDQRRGRQCSSSVDPERIIRMLLVGYRSSIRSDRRLCQQVELDLAYRWFCRLGPEDMVQVSVFVKPQLR